MKRYSESWRRNTVYACLGQHRSHRLRWRGGRPWATAAAGLFVAVTAATSGATTITVNTTSTGSPTGFCGGALCCSIRQAIQAVNTKATVNGCPAGNGNNDRINLPSGTFTAASPLIISQPVVIHGNGIGVTILRGNLSTSDSFFKLQPPSAGFSLTTEFQNVTLDRTGGAATVTGIFTNQHTLRINGSRIAGFTASGIFASDADINLIDTTIENNSAPFFGGGIQLTNPSAGSINSGIYANRVTFANNHSGFQGGGIYAEYKGNGALYATTFSGNSSGDGGAIYQAADTDYLFFYGCTVANNTATGSGGGIVANFGVKLTNSIFGQNSAPSGTDISGSVNNCQNTLIGTTLGTTQLADDGGNLFDVPPDLDTVLRDLGGSFHTKVLRPFPFSPAIDAFGSSFLIVAPTDSVALDARGARRPQFGGFVASNGDMGAFESSRLEAETVNFAGKSSAPYFVISNSQMSSGGGTNLQANAANHFITYSTSVALPAGTYSVTVGYRKASNAGRFQLGVATSAGGTFTSIGAVQDGYASSPGVVSVGLGNITVAGSSARFFRFFVPGKNTSSSSYQVFPDFIDFTKQ